ncbi:MAG: hypothetical protein HY271_14790 [Deltaproteobacteria bacterium]|nr:hypothetical protein [Deltaproteobacteria bacterium]
MKGNDDPHLNGIIRHVRLYIQQRDGVSLVLTARPDQEERNAPACDALLEGSERRYAIEHTRLDTYEREGLDQARFIRVLDPLHWSFWGRLDDDLQIAVPVHAIPSGCNWRIITSKIEEYILGTAWRSLPLDESTRVSLDGVPFPLEVRRTNHGPGGSLFIRRVVSNDRDQRVEAYRTLQGNAVKFCQFNGYRIVLVVESDQVAITSRELLFQEFARAATSDNTQPYDDILLIRTGAAPWCIVPLKVGDIQSECVPYWPAAPGYPPQLW